MLAFVNPSENKSKISNTIIIYKKKSEYYIILIVFPTNLFC